MGRWPDRWLQSAGKAFLPGPELAQHHVLLRSLKTSWAAFRPAAPMTPPPGTKTTFRSPPERDRAGLREQPQLEQLPQCLGSLRLPHTAGGLSLPDREALRGLAEMLRIGRGHRGHSSLWEISPTAQKGCHQETTATVKSGSHGVGTAKNF